MQVGQRLWGSRALQGGGLDLFLVRGNGKGDTGPFLNINERRGKDGNEVCYTRSAFQKWGKTSVINHNGKNYIYIYVCMSKSFFYTPELTHIN